MCLFYRKPDSCSGEAEAPASMALGCSPPGNGICWDVAAEKESPRTTQGPPNAPNPGPQQQIPGVSGSSVIAPFRFLGKRKVQAHICTQKLYTAQISEAGVLQMAGVSKCKRKWKLCRREKK